MNAFSCPRCRKTSHNPNDAREGYCGNCHAFTRSAEAIDLARFVNTILADIERHQTVCECVDGVLPGGRICYTLQSLKDDIARANARARALGFKAPI